MIAGHALPSYQPIRQDWLARHVEPVLDPELPIIDPHFHLWDTAHSRYLLDEFIADTGSGHNVVSSVYIQAFTMHRADGPEALRPVGETEFVRGVAAMSRSGQYGQTKVAEGIVAFADLRLGDAVAEVLEAQAEAAGGRLRGIRQLVTWDADPVVHDPKRDSAPGMLADAKFRQGFARLAQLGLSFDAWLYQPQIRELTGIARAFPGTSIVLDHFGGPLRIGGYAGRNDVLFADWRAAIEELATCPNVSAKLGGLGMRFGNFGFADASEPPTSQALAEAWRPFIETTIAAFGPERCMFESNFPVDKSSCSYAVLWNAFKRLAAGASAAERAALFSGTARRFYRLG